MTAAFIIICYLVILLIIGLTSSKRIKRKDDFWVAGRSLPVLILVATLVATWIGSGALFSVADLSYHHGFSSLIASAGGWLGILIVYFIAHRIRLFKLYTIPDILELRYNRTARILASIATVFAQIIIFGFGRLKINSLSLIESVFSV